MALRAPGQGLWAGWRLKVSSPSPVPSLRSHLEPAALLAEAKVLPIDGHTRRLEVIATDLQGRVGRRGHKLATATDAHVWLARCARRRQPLHPPLQARWGRAVSSFGPISTHMIFLRADKGRAGRGQQE